MNDPTMNKNMLRRVCGAVLVVAAFVLCGCAPTGSGPSVDGDPVLRLGVMVEPPTFDPAGAGTGQSLTPYFPVYDSLLTLDAEGQPAPNLAKSFAWDESGTALTLTLEEDIRFHDDAPFDAAAVKANIQHFQNFVGGVAGPVLALVESVDTPSEYVVTLNLSAADPSLPFVLAGPAGLMGSPEALGTEEIASVPVGTGAYQLDPARTVIGSEYVYVRAGDYWGGAVAFAEVRLVILIDETARLNALRTGQVDVANMRQPINATDAEAAGLTVDERVGLWEGLFFLDREGELDAPIADPRVREALRIAIDADAMIQIIRAGYGEKTGQIFPETADAYLPELDDAYPYDPERARKLLAEAGYPDGFSIPFPRTSTIAADYYVAIEQYWKEIGVTARPHQWAQGEPLPSLQAGEFAVVYFSNILLDSWSTVNFSVAPQARYNAFETEDPRINALMGTMQNGSDAERRKAGRALNRYLIQESWFGPLYRVEEFVVSNNAVDVNTRPGYLLPPMDGYVPSEGAKP